MPLWMWSLAGLLLKLALATQEPHWSREGKVLSYRHNTEDLNIEHIISLWNRSATDETTSSTEWPATTTTKKTPQLLPKMEQKKENSPFSYHKIPDNFSDRFSYCVKIQKLTSKAYPDQGIIIKCLKAELITKLHKLLANPSDTIKLFNGYLEFEKLDSHQKEISENDIVKNVLNPVLPTKKRYSSRVSAKKPLEPESSQPFIPVALKQPKASQSHANDYYEAYQKMLKELVARKSGTDQTREKRASRPNPGTLEKSAKLFEKGRKLFTEITNNLENGEEEVETLTQTILDPELVSSINNFTRAYSLRLNFYPGVAARMKRNENSGVTFDLELDDLSESEDEDNEEDDGGRDGKKKKKKPKISKKTLKKLFPYLLIPFMIQAALLPIVLKFLLFVAIKALIAGKLALILVAFNAIRNASLKSDEDEYVERMSYEHYGYGNGEEYGAWVNRRAMNVPQDSDTREGIAEEEYAEPYSAYKPNTSH